MADRHAAGHLVLGVARFVAEGLPQDVRRRVRRATPALVKALPTVQPTGWYPLSYVVDQCKAIDELYEDADESFQAITRAGQYIAEDGVTTFMRLLIKVVTPNIFVRQFPSLWKKYHDFGELTVDFNDVVRERASFGMPGYEYVVGLATGWIHFAFESLAKKVTVSSNYVWRAPMPDVVRLDMDWTA